MKKLKGVFFDGGALVLAIFTALGLISFAASGGHKAIQEKGFKEAAKAVIEQQTDAPITQDLYKKNYNE